VTIRVGKIGKIEATSWSLNYEDSTSVLEEKGFDKLLKRVEKPAPKSQVKT